VVLDSVQINYDIVGICAAAHHKKNYSLFMHICPDNLPAVKSKTPKYTTKSKLSWLTPITWKDGISATEVNTECNATNKHMLDILVNCRPNEIQKNLLQTF